MRFPSQIWYGQKINRPTTNPSPVGQLDSRVDIHVNHPRIQTGLNKGPILLMLQRICAGVFLQRSSCVFPMAKKTKLPTVQLCGFQAEFRWNAEAEDWHPSNDSFYDGNILGARLLMLVAQMRPKTPPPWPTCKVAYGCLRAFASHPRQETELNQFLNRKMNGKSLAPPNSSGYNPNQKDLPMHLPLELT